jgi:hypothetical protein
LGSTVLIGRISALGWQAPGASVISMTSVLTAFDQVSAQIDVATFPL